MNWFYSAGTVAILAANVVWVKLSSMHNSHKQPISSRMHDIPISSACKFKRAYKIDPNLMPDFGLNGNQMKHCGLLNHLRIGLLPLFTRVNILLDMLGHIALIKARTDFLKSLVASKMPTAF